MPVDTLRCLGKSAVVVSKCLFIRVLESEKTAGNSRKSKLVAMFKPRSDAQSCCNLQRDKVDEKHDKPMGQSS